MTRRLLALTMLLSACTSGPPLPEEPVWGKQPCDHCSMLLSDPSSAAQAVLANGSRKFFDDVGCLAAYLAQPSVRAAVAWVRTPEGRWSDAQRARFAGGHVTPMDYGYLAAREGISFGEVQRLVLIKNRLREENR